jgi:hypothetical protein
LRLCGPEVLEEVVRRMSAWALVSGLLGALLVFVLGVIREAWRNDQEKLGLLRLLLAEIEHNAEVTKTIGEATSDLLSSQEFSRSMNTETWRDVRTKAARLLPQEMRKALVDYYAPLQTLKTLLTFSGVGNDRMNRSLRGQRNPYEEYLNKTLDQQGKTQAQIETYLELSWSRRWFDFLNSSSNLQEDAQSQSGSQEKTQENA